jgi:hypothetical protein
MKEFFALFTDFEQYGNLTWLAIPVLVYFLITIRRRNIEERILALILFLSYLFLSIKGKSYPRYLFTLFPFLLAVIFLNIWEFMKKKQKVFQLGIFLLCGLSVLGNSYHFRKSLLFFIRYKMTAVDDYFPHEVMKYINDASDINFDNQVLVCSHRHLFFYHTEKKGIDFRDPQLENFNRQKSTKDALGVLRNQLHVTYILRYWNFNLSPILKDIITNYCDLRVQDKAQGLELYYLRKKGWTKEDLEELFPNDSLIHNGSLEYWGSGPLKTPDGYGGDNIFEGTVTREEKEVKVGRYSAKCTGDNFNLAQNLSTIETFRGKKITCFAWVKTSIPDKYRIQIFDDKNESVSIRHSGSGSWELLQANFQVHSQAKFVTIRLIQAQKTGQNDAVVYLDGALLVEGDWNTFFFYQLSLKKTQNVQH